MKKFLKSIAKKSLSLFLAVVMLLSCWVWIAPERAEAADPSPETGWYQVMVKVDISDTFGHGMEKHEYVINGYPLTLNDKYKNLDVDDGDLVEVARGWVKGFPSSFAYTLKYASTNSSGSCSDGKGAIANQHTYVYDNNDSIWRQITTGDGHKKDFNKGDEYTMDPSGWGTGLQNLPKFEKKNSTNDGAAAITIPTIGSTNTIGTSYLAVSVWDDYGVRMDYEKSHTFDITSDENGDVSESQIATKNNGFYINKAADGLSAQVCVDANMQEKLKGDNDELTKVYYLVTKTQVGEEVYKASKKISITYPQYTVTVNADGASLAMSKGPNHSGTWSKSGVYGTEADPYPTGGKDEAGNYLGATKPGTTFKGFWTVPQPTTGNASFNADEAKFAAPVNSTQFDKYCKEVNDTDGDSFVTVENDDGTKSNYYNAGTEWVADTDKSILRDSNFYAWWIAGDIPVKFYDIDGKFLGAKTGKFGIKPNADWYPDPKTSYNAGAYDYEGFTGQWMDISGDIITEGSYTFGDHTSLTLTPVYSKNQYKSTYNVTFINPVNGTNNNGTGTYDYRTVLSYPIAGMPTTLKNDYGYSYEFEGWTTQKPAEGHYHVVAADDTTFAVNNDWAVKADVTYYAVFRSTIKEYVVSYTYTDTTGTSTTDIAYVPYGAAITTPSNVNHTFAKGGYGYNLEGWEYTAADTSLASFLKNDAIILNETNLMLAESSLKGGKEEPIPFTAYYDEGQPTPYTVTFKYMNDAGTEITKTEQVYHDYAITQEVVDKINVPAKYDDGKALYTFAGKWKVTEGVSAEPEYKTENLAAFMPTSHVTFEAVYGEGVPFYTVAYNDRGTIYTERILKGSNVPAWMVETGETDENGKPKMEEYVPADYNSELGTNKFAGWFDAKEGGTKYTTADIVTGDLVLYSQFVFEPFKFEIKFMNHDGTKVLDSIEVEAGKSFEATLKNAEALAAERPADKEYSYTFIGWDKKVPDNYLCEGTDVTYIALYRPNYISYKARWYNDIKAMNNAALPEMEVVGVGGLLAITSHIYNGSVYAPSVNLTPVGDVAEGETLTFAGWHYIENGAEKAYQRGMKITADMKFYAKYIAKKNAVTLTAIVNGEETVYPLEYGSKAPAIGDPVDGYVDKTNHNKFIGWYDAETGGNEFDFNSKITANTTIYARFETAAHSKTMRELVTAPTYYATGSEIIWCACNKDETDETVEIPMLTDKVAPTGTIYLGTQGSWSSTDAVGAAATDNDEVAFYANADTDIILTINDTGDVNDAYNPAGAGKGVAIIQGIISTGVFGADTTEIAGIQTIFTDDSQTQNNTANYVIRLGTYPNLVDGETYIAYYYAKDKAGNVLNKNVRTAKFIYDVTDPEFTITGDNNKAAAGAVTYCATATVTGIEDGATLTVNGEVKAYTDGKYVINEAGNYLVKVTDKAGNSTSEKIIVNAGHDEIRTEKKPTCTEDGYDKITCAICEKVIKNETIKSEGHKLETSTVAPTCTEDGYDLAVCSVCGYEDKTNVKPAVGHVYEKDTEGKIVYTVIKAANCNAAGKKIANCTVCGKGTLTVEIPVDEDAHVYGVVRTLKATCTEPGEKYQLCKYCGDKIETKIDAINHEGTDRYTKVTNPATCFSTGIETEFCKDCGAPVGTKDIEMIDHTLKLVTYATDADKSVDYPDGYTQYECQATGCTHTEGKEKISPKPTYTVTFKGEDGSVIKEISKKEGESIDAKDVADQTKAADNTYTYTFAGWIGEDGKVIKLPIKVTKNTTYTAKFNSTKIIYTHKFTVEGEEFATIIGSYNDTGKKPLAVPTKKSDDPNTTYEFAGWVNKLGDGAVETKFDMIEDAEFVAEFTEYTKDCTVVYYNGTQYLYSATITAGGSVSYPADKAVPVKESDALYHYDFNGWLYNGVLYDEINTTFSNITANTRIYASFAKEAHDLDDFVLIQAATCTEPGKQVATCPCGDATKEEIIQPLGHDFSVALEGGSLKCSRCEETKEPEAKEVTLTFRDDEDNLIKTVKVKEGKTYTITAPEKASTAQYDFTFSAWTLDGVEVAKTAEYTVTAVADATYVANYTGETRSYYVAYLNWNHDLLYSELVKYGMPMPEYPDALATPKREPSSTHHFKFASWSDFEEGMTVTGEIQFMAQYSADEHNLHKEVTEEATCTKPKTTYRYCDNEDCDYREAKGKTDNVLKPHTPNEAGYSEYEAPGLGKPGKQVFVCSMCGQTITETLPAIAADVIEVVVYDTDGNLAVNGTAHITLYEIVGDEEVLFEGPRDTGATGSFTFTVEKGKKWRVTITGDNIKGGYGGTVKAGKNVFGTPAVEEDDTNTPDNSKCKCNCHKTTFWGLIFRFFQKIIMKFTGSPRCCDDPDYRIWK